jgi:hypothetical protein
MAVLDGVPAERAVAFVRAHYDRHAVETPWQRRYVRLRARVREATGYRRSHRAAGGSVHGISAPRTAPPSRRSPSPLQKRPGRTS